MGKTLRYTISIIAVIVMICMQGWARVSLMAQSNGQDHIGLMSSIYQNDVRAVIPLTELLSRVEQNFNVTFLYEKYLLANKFVHRDQINLEEEAGRELSGILDKLGFTYHQIDEETYVVLPKTPIEKVAILQQHITGVVTDSETGETIPGVNIRVVGAEFGTITNIDGEYVLANIPETAQQLIFSYVGYPQRIVEIDGRTVINIELEQGIAVLDDIVVIGYGERQRGDITGSVSFVRSDQLEQSLSLSPDIALQGRAPGVFVSNISGNPLSRPQVHIRGVTTFGVSEPLYVIDGVPVTEFGAGVEGLAGGGNDLRGTVNIFNLINPNDIESISVLKDASAAAVYGVRAANGVILITTKSGQQGRPRIEVNASRGVQNIPKTVDVLNVSQYVDLYNEAYANNPDLAGTLPSVFNSASADYLGNSTFTDWQDAYINHNAVLEDYNIRLSGGDASSTYYVSTGFSRSEGTIRGVSMDRYSLAANFDSRITDRIRFGATYRLAYLDALDNMQGASITEAFPAPPWQPIYDHNASFWQDDSFYAATLGYAPTTNFANETLWGPQRRFNNLARQELNENRYQITRNIGTGYVEFQPIQNLALRAQVNIDRYQNIRTNYNDAEAHFFSWTAGPPENLEPGSVGSLGERNSVNTNITGEFRINYVNNFGGHHFDILGNVLRQEYDVLGTDAQGLYIANREKEQRYIQRTGEPTSTTAFHWLQEDALLGIMGRLSYHYDSRYYLDVTVRRDGSSRFAPEYRWGTFPSFALAWRISSENFMSNVNFLDDLKIRAGWGQLGNQETARFAFLSSVGTEPTIAFGSGGEDPAGRLVEGIRLPDFPTENLTWEVVTTLNIGFDALMLNNRLSLTAEYYNRYTDGILQSVPIAPSLGVDNNPIINVADVSNRGMEFQLGFRDFLGPVQYEVSGSLTTINNEVMGMFDDTPVGGTENRIEIGYPIGYFWGHKVDGIFQNQSEIDQWLASNSEPGSIKSPGDIRFVDVNGDGVIDADDRTFLGSPIPGYYYGLNMNLMYKGFDMSFFFQGVGDVQRINGVRWGGESMSSDGVNQMTSVLNRWTPENPSTKMPRAVHDDPGNNNRFSDRWVENADYFRLKNFTLGYTLQPDMVNRIGMNPGSMLRLFVSSSNLLTLTSWRGIDPENDTIPPARVISLGLSVTFQ